MILKKSYLAFEGARKADCLSFCDKSGKLDVVRGIVQVYMCVQSNQAMYTCLHIQSHTPVERQTVKYLLKI